MGVEQAVKRIPRIRFPRRHAKPSGSASESVAGNANKTFSSSSDVPVGPSNLSEGGKASLQPKRTPVTNKEIEAILLGGCI